MVVITKMHICSLIFIQEGCKKVHPREHPAVCVADTAARNRRKQP